VANNVTFHFPVHQYLDGGTLEGRLLGWHKNDFDPVAGEYVTKVLFIELHETAMAVKQRTY